MNKTTAKIVLRWATVLLAASVSLLVILCLLLWITATTGFIISSVLAFVYFVIAIYAKTAGGK